MSDARPVQQLRRRRLRRQLAIRLVGWALTAASVTIVTTLIGVIQGNEQRFDTTAAELASSSEIRDHIAERMITAAQGISSVDRSDTERLAQSLDINAVTNTLIDLYGAATGNRPMPNISWADLTDLDPASFGAPDNVEVVIVVDTPSLASPLNLLSKVRLVALLTSAVLALAATVIAADRTRPIRRLGSWSLFSGFAVAAIAIAAPVVLGQVGGVGGVVAAEFVTTATPQLWDVAGAVAGAGAVLWSTGLVVGRRRALQLAHIDLNPITATLTPSSPLDVGAAAGERETVNEPSRLRYWERPGHPLPVEAFRHSDATTDLSTQEQRDIADITVAAWTNPTAAGADAVQMVRMLSSDRGSFHQVATFWDCHPGTPRAAAAVVFAYEDFSLYAPYYAATLDVPEWVLIERVGQLVASVRSNGLDGCAQRLANIYRDLITTVEEVAPAEALRLDGILMRLPVMP